MSEKSQLLEFIERIQEWHGARLSAARDIQSNAKEGTTVKVIGDAGKETRSSLPSVKQ